MLQGIDDVEEIAERRASFAEERFSAGRRELTRLEILHVDEARPLDRQVHARAEASPGPAFRSASAGRA
jgi:hypothetical protein